MNDIEKILQLLLQHSQALHNDGLLYLSGEETIATPERKAIFIRDIKMILELVNLLESKN